MPGIGIITNPNSRLFRHHPERMDAFFKIAQDRAVLTATKNANDAFVAAHDFKERDIDLLIINGGDGTVRITLGKFIEAYGERELPPAAIIPSGTMNTTAASLGIKGNPEKILSSILEKYERGEIFSIAQRNILKINGEYGFIFGNGFFYNFLKIYYERAYPYPIKGFMLLSRAVLSTIFKSRLYRQLFRPFNARLRIDGHDLGEKTYSSIACSSIPYIGFGFNPFPKALEKKNFFQVMGFPPEGSAVLKNLPKFFSGRDPSGDIFQAVASRINIDSDTPLGYQLDGEMQAGLKSLEISSGPYLRLVSGRNIR